MQITNINNFTILRFLFLKYNGVSGIVEFFFNSLGFISEKLLPDQSIKCEIKTSINNIFDKMIFTFVQAMK